VNSGAIWAVPDDPRCTKLGSYLRRFGMMNYRNSGNVLRGEMSLVGPRPERHGIHSRTAKRTPGIRSFVIRTARHHRLRARSTDGEDSHSIEERLRHDMYYVRNWSLWLDAIHPCLNAFSRLE
jgi:lipopolysaccharide/colanic/teichoic acid biosynthesis glycosyltransferase